MDQVTRRHFIRRYGNLPPEVVDKSTFDNCVDEKDARKTLRDFKRFSIAVSEEHVADARKRVTKQITGMKRRQHFDEEEGEELLDALETEVAKYKKNGEYAVKRHEENYQKTLERMAGPGLSSEEQLWFTGRLIDLFEPYEDNVTVTRILQIMLEKLSEYRRPAHIFDTLKLYISVKRQEADFKLAFDH
jgi:hypothetical protein